MSSQDAANHAAAMPASWGAGAQQPGATATPVALDHVAAADNIRSSAKWVIAASASVAAVLVAGLRLDKLTSLPGEWLKVCAVISFLIAFFCASLVLVRAAMVLVPRRVTLSSLSDLQKQDLDAKQAMLEGALPSEGSTEEQLELDLGIDAGQPPAGPPPLPRVSSAAQSQQSSNLLTRLAKRLGKLFYGPEDDPLSYVDAYREVLDRVNVGSVTDLLHLYHGHRPQSLFNNPMPPPERVEASVQQLVTFVELQQASHRFNVLMKGITRSGPVFAVSILAFALIAGVARPPDPPRVTSPLPVSVVFSGTAEALYKAGLAGCQGKTLNATAVSGEMRAPEVLVEPANGCPGGLKKISHEIGVVVYKNTGSIDQQVRQDVTVVEPSERPTAGDPP